MSSRRSRPLPSGWERLRRKVLQRDGHICQLRYDRCLVIAIEVDHVHGPASDDLANLQAVCRRCHATKTGREARATQPSRRRAAEPHPGVGEYPAI